MASLFGRERELDRLLALVRRDGRVLIVVCGPPGIGKTALATALVGRVDKSVILDAEHVTSIDELGCAIGPREANLAPAKLVVVDALDGLVRDAARAMACVRAAAPLASIVVTSRARLRLRNETTVELEPLPLQIGAKLFLDVLARAHGARDEPDASVAKQARAVAQRMDGIPLAIELAAGRAAVLGIESVLETGTSRLDTVGRAARDMGRGRTLREILASSYASLAEDERAAFERIAVFKSPFTLDAAVAIVGRGSGTHALLHALREASLVQTMNDPSPPRFFLFGILRDFAEERLDPRTRKEAWEAHARYVLGSPDLDGDPEDIVSDPERLERRAELREELTAIADRFPEGGFGCAALVALGPIVLAWGGAESLRARLDRALSKRQRRDRNVMRALALRARLRRRTGDPDGAEEDAKAALAIARALRDRRLEGRILAHRAFTRAGTTGDNRTVRALLQEAIAAHDDADDDVALALTLARRAAHARDRGALEEARDDAARALGVAEGVQHRAYVALARVELGLCLVELDEDDALACLEQAEAEADRAGDRFVQGYARVGIAMHLHARGVLGRARTAYEAALALVGEVPRTAACLSGYLAVVDLERGSLVEARTTLRSAARTLTRTSEHRYAALFSAYSDLLASRRVVVVARSRKSVLTDDAIVLAARVLGAPTGRDLERAEALARRSSDLRIALRVVRSHGSVMGDVRASGTRPLVVSIPRRSVELPDAKTIDLATRPALLRLIAKLVEARLAEPGRAVMVDALVRAGWPDERITRKAADNRLRVAMATLRRLGVGALVRTVRGGYVLDATTPARLMSD